QPHRHRCRACVLVGRSDQVAISARSRPAGAGMNGARKAVISFAAALTTLALAAPVAAQDNSFGQIERGRYLTAASNCQGCHTAPREEPFAGSRGLETPFGVIYTPNIT